MPQGVGEFSNMDEPSRQNTVAACWAGRGFPSDAPHASRACEAIGRGKENEEAPFGPCRPPSLGVRGGHRRSVPMGRAGAIDDEMKFTYVHGLDLAGRHVGFAVSTRRVSSSLYRACGESLQ